MSSPGTVAITGTKDISDDPLGSSAMKISGKDIGQSLQSGMGWAWVMLVVSLLLSVTAFYLVKSSSHQVAEDRFEFREAEITDALKQRMTAYTEALRGGLGLFRASNNVSRKEWQVYVETLSLNRLFPGIQGLGYAEWVMPEQRASYEAAIRAEGFPKFKIRPTGQRSPYTSITFLEPFDERNKQAFGYDMYSNKMRRGAMDLARDTGRVAISGRVRLVQEIKGKVQAGFLMYLPYYKGAGPFDTVEKRRAASQGFVYSPFRMDDLMKGILGLGLPNVHLQIFDGEMTTPDSLMYDSAPESTHAAPAFSKALQLLIGQHTWTIKITSLPPFEAMLDPVKSYATLFAGVLASLLFFGVLWSFATTRQRAQMLAAEMTVTLEEHANELIRSNEELESFAYVASHDLKAPLRGIDNLATWIEEDLGENLKGESRENMNLLPGRIKRLEALLSDLLTFSKAGQGEVSVESVNLNEFISDLFDLLNVDRKFNLQLSVPSEPIKIIKTTLEQVVGNLISNALKHHDTGDGHLFINIRELDKCYEFTVADDGPGVPPEHRERVFQMFQTLQPRDTVEGSGMGLAIIRRIVEKQGGKIFLEDRAEGKGASFRFYWNKID